MRLLLWLGVVAVTAAGCGADHARHAATCVNVNLQPRKFEPPSESYVISFGQPLSRCGRVFERTMISMTHHQLNTSVTGIKCEQFFGPPSCYMETSRGCVAAIGVGGWREFIFRRIPRSAAGGFCSDLHSP